MTPYYQDSAVTIYHGDCRELLPQLEPVDLVLTDPPYSEVTHRGARTRMVGASSSILVDFKSISYKEAKSDIELMLSVSMGWVVCTSEWRFAARFEEDGLPLIRFGVWIKPNGAPQLSGDRPSTGWEAVLCFRSNTSAIWNGGGSRSVWTCNRVDANLHPTEKPIRLFKEFVRLFSNNGSVILDPFMGSGTTLRAAKDLDRKAIGIEIEEKYCEIAAKRMSQEVLPFEPPKQQYIEQSGFEALLTASETELKGWLE